MIDELLERVKKLEQALYDSYIYVQNAITSENKTKNRNEIQSQTFPGLQFALCVDTVDPEKRGRIRVYSHFMENKSTTKDGLVWAEPISPFGGFDDSGSPWVPPAGSRVALLFDGGNPGTPYYIGTSWTQHRGGDSDDGSNPGHQEFWDYPEMHEYDCLWKNKRNGYLSGGNTGDQVYPPWNTESYNGYDNDSTTDFYNDAFQFQTIAHPNIKGFKTEGKHGLKLVDGDPVCNYRWKRLEMFSGCGNWLMFKDDHLHPSGQWAFGSLNLGIAQCQVNEVPREWPCCTPKPSNLAGCTPATCSADAGGGCSPLSQTTDSSVNRTQKFANPFFKRQEEMRPYTGANTPMANSCELEQSGIWMQSISGQQFLMSDEVDQPTGVPSWDRKFDFGCNDIFKGYMRMRSATGHEIKLSDIEDTRKNRGEENGIFMETAWGNRFSLCDETIKSGDSCSCPPNFGGPNRGLFAQTTSNHIFRMCDHHVHQCGTPRLNDGVPKKEDQHQYEGYILLRSGYGLQLLMKDDDIQTETKQQFIQLLAPQKDNTQRGPHMLVMQEVKQGPGLVLLRAGGVIWHSSHDDSVEVVGDKGSPDPANKFVEVKDNYLVDVNKYYFNHAEEHIFLADKYIFLLAGQDCPVQASTAAQASAQAKASPCVFPVIVADDGWTCPMYGFVHYGMLPDPANPSGPPLYDSRSNRVFASTKVDDKQNSGNSTVNQTIPNYKSAGGPASQVLPQVSKALS